MDGALVGGVQRYVEARGVLFDVDAAVAYLERAGAGQRWAEDGDGMAGRGVLGHLSEVHPVLGRLDERFAQGLLGRRGDVVDVVVRHLLQRVPGTGGGRKIVAGEPMPKLGDRAAPGEDARIGHGRPQVRRHGQRLDPASPAPRQVQLALQVEAPARGLVRVLVADPVEDVVVQLVQRDLAVLVAIGVPGDQALHQGVGEDRRLWPGLFGQLVTLEGVLHRGGRGDDGLPAPSGPRALPGEAVQHVDVAGRAHHGPFGEGSAVAAVQEQHDALGPATAHAALDEVGRNGGGAETVGASVAGGEEQLP